MSDVNAIKRTACHHGVWQFQEVFNTVVYFHALGPSNAGSKVSEAWTLSDSLFNLVDLQSICKLKRSYASSAQR